MKEEYGIRKFTPKECWRLMNFKESDYEQAHSVNSETQLYKQAGNSIVSQVLIAIFSQMGIQGHTKWNDMSDEEKESFLAINSEGFTTTSEGVTIIK